MDGWMDSWAASHWFDQTSKPGSDKVRAGRGMGLHGVGWGDSGRERDEGDVPHDSATCRVGTGNKQPSNYRLLRLA
jgi:hypothetical protein